ncbi:MAG: hypothetical protein LC797_06290 [Chloroflexi bacterium]|nr:hypothetical protein [Chloroflexota bacterium]
MREVLVAQPALAHAVRSLSLHDQLSLTLELLREADWPETPTTEETRPANVVPFSRPSAP